MPETLAEVVETFPAARGVPDDVGWARTAAARFLLDDAPEDLASAALAGVAAQVAETGESPEELWGDPVEWAREQRRAWRADGLAAAPTAAAGPRELVLATIIGAASIEVMFFVVSTISRTWTQQLSAPRLLAPVLLSGAGQVVRAVYERVLRARSQRAAVISVGVTLVLLAPLIAAVFLGTRDRLLGEVSTFWLLAIAAGYGAVAVLVARVWRPKASRGGRTDARRVPGDEAWLIELAGELRQRGDMTDQQVRRVVAEARDHATDAGQPLHEEFGGAAAYAARFAPDERVASRRRAWFFSVLAVLPAGLLVAYVVEDGWRWGSPHLSASLWLALNVVLAVTSWRSVRRASRPHDVTGSTYR